MPILFQSRNIRRLLDMYITKQAEQEIYLIAHHEEQHVQGFMRLFTPNRHSAKTALHKTNLDPFGPGRRFLPSSGDVVPAATTSHSLWADGAEPGVVFLPLRSTHLWDLTRGLTSDALLHIAVVLSHYSHFSAGHLSAGTDLVVGLWPLLATRPLGHRLEAPSFVLVV